MNDIRGEYVGISIEIIDLLRQYRSEWDNAFPDPIMKKNLRDRMFKLLGEIEKL